MAGRDGKYPNSKVGFEQNNNAGATDRLFIDNDGFFNTDGQDVSGDQLRNALYVPMQVQRCTPSTVSTSFADASKNLTSGIGTVIFSVLSNATTMSFWLTSCVIGREVLLKVLHGSVGAASAAVWISGSGCTIIGLISLVSGFYLRSSVASCGFAKLKCFDDNVWTVVDYNTSYAES